MLSDEYIKKQERNGKKIWKYARFGQKVNRDGVIGYVFYKHKSDWLSLRQMGLGSNAADEYSAYFVIDAWELDGAIEEITHPFILSQEKTEAINKAISDMVEHPKHDWDDSGLLILWFLYIAALIGSLIFKDFYILWAVATFVFVKIRKDMKNQ